MGPLLSRENEEETMRKKAISHIEKYFLTGHDRVIRSGDMSFCVDDLWTAKRFTKGGFNDVYLVGEANHEIVVKMNKPIPLLMDTYESVSTQMKHLGEYMDRAKPEDMLRIAKTSVISSPLHPKKYLLLQEYIKGEPLKMSQLYTDSDLQEEFQKFSRAYRLLIGSLHNPIALDIIGIKQAVQTGLYGLELKDDFEFTNVMVRTPTHALGKKELWLIDTGHELLRGNPVRVAANWFAASLQEIVMYHAGTIAKGAKESLIR